MNEKQTAHPTLLKEATPNRLRLRAPLIYSTNSADVADAAEVVIWKVERIPTKESKRKERKSSENLSFLLAA